MPGLEHLSLLAIGWIVFALALAGLVHGTLGLGYPLIATPLIALVVGIKTAVIIVAPAALVVVIAAIALGGPALPSLREWWRMPIWMLIGSLAGTYAFMLTDAAPLTLLLAVAILVYLGLDRLGRGESVRVQRHKHKFGALFGFCGGFFEGSVNIAAPPLLIYFLSLGLAPAALVKALNLCFFTGKTTQVTTLLVSGEAPAALWLSALLLSLIGVGTLILGMRIRNRVDAVTYRRWMKVALAAIAVILIGQFYFLMRPA